MKKLLSAVAALALLTSPAFANEGEVTNAPGAEAAAEAAATAPAADAPASIEATADVQEATLADGTQLSIEGDAVFVVDAAGTKTPAPDGEHTLADGSTLKTAGGHIAAE